jgi:hypothetical protein
MYVLPIKRALSEETRVQTVRLCSKKIFDLHKGLGDDDAYYITQHGNPENIYMAISKELYDTIFND